MKQIHKEMFARSHKAGEQDTWLTSPELLKALGKFDLDPCCPAKMPWRTARKMIHQPKDGLAVEWRGRVWCNPPYSSPLPWVQKMAEHGDGVMLLSANIDTRYGQLALRSSDAVLFVQGRLLFHKLDGSLSKGKWLRNMLVAYGKDNVETLRALSQGTVSPGVVMVRKSLRKQAPK